MSCKTQLKQAADMYIEVFHKYANCTENKEDGVLDKDEFKKMIEEQFPDCLKHAKDPEGIEKLFQELDRDNNGRIDFVECSTLMGKFLMCVHERFHEKFHEHQPHGYEHPHAHAPRH